MIVLTPNLMEYKLRVRGNFFEFILLKLYLNILAFSMSGFSPVSWHLEMNNSESSETSTVVEVELEHILDCRRVYSLWRLPTACGFELAIGMHCT